MLCYAVLEDRKNGCGTGMRKEDVGGILIGRYGRTDGKLLETQRNGSDTILANLAGRLAAGVFVGGYQAHCHTVQDAERVFISSHPSTFFLQERISQRFTEQVFLLKCFGNGPMMWHFPPRGQFAHIVDPMFLFHSVVSN
jgi:hypothetical protein